MEPKTVPILGARVRLSTLAVFMACAYATLAVGSLFTRIDAWYEGLAKPDWTPPGWVIGTVWTTLYTLIGVAAAIAWQTSVDAPARRAFAWTLATNLVLNATWSLLFFTLHQIGLALAEILVLAISTLLLAWVAYRRHRTAGFLLAPYAAWVLFASFLTFTIWRLNP